MTPNQPDYETFRWAEYGSGHFVHLKQKGPAWDV
jgi:hypothetical protein